jgi:hypothetical protein
MDTEVTSVNSSHLGIEIVTFEEPRDRTIEARNPMKENSSNTKKRQNENIIPTLSKMAKSHRTSIVFTGVRPSKDQKSILKTLGVEVVNSVERAEILIAKQVARTEKFLLGITKGISIVSEHFLLAYSSFI